MHQIKTLSEFNLDQESIIEELRQSGEPLHLSCDDGKEIVIMDAVVFDEQMSFCKSACAEAMHVKEDLVQGCRDYIRGNIVEAEEVEKAVMAGFH